MKDIPKDRLICKYCVHCKVFDENSTKETAICNVDIRELTHLSNEGCCDFEYDDSFIRY